VSATSRGRGEQRKPDASFAEIMEDLDRSREDRF